MLSAGLGKTDSLEAGRFDAFKTGPGLAFGILKYFPELASEGQPRRLVDTRQLGKPDKFSGEPSEFEDWSFILEAYMCCVDREFAALFERIRYSDVPILQSHLTPMEAELSTQLFYTLVMLLQGRALDIAQNTDLGNGFEVYRKLVSEYRPRLPSRLVGTLTQLMSHRFTASIEAEIPFFEKLIMETPQKGYP